MFHSSLKREINANPISKTSEPIIVPILKMINSRITPLPLHSRKHFYDAKYLELKRTRPKESSMDYLDDRMTNLK
jgi:hypothetical protein